jgi:hypothetical protein
VIPQATTSASTSCAEAAGRQRENR